MFCRAKIGLPALSLPVLLSVPLELMAAPRGRRGFRGHGFRGGHAFRQGHIGGGFRFGRGGRGVTHFRGFGHIRRGGFGFGFRTRHFRSPLRIRSPHPRSFRGPRIYGYPYGYAYPYGSYSPYGYSYGFGYGGVAAVGVPVITGYTSGAPPPTIIIIQEGPQRPSVHMPAPQAPYEERGPTGASRRLVAGTKPARPLSRRNPSNLKPCWSSRTAPSTRSPNTGKRATNSASSTATGSANASPWTNSIWPSPRS